MENTSLTLLGRLQVVGDSAAWDRLFDLYQPWLVIWIKKYGVQDSDADDVAQEVLLTVSKGLKTFDHNGRIGAFRTWLRSILVNRLRNFWRTRDRKPEAQKDSEMDRRLSLLEDSSSEMSLLWNRQHDLHILHQLLNLVEPQFSKVSWKAFLRVAINGEPPAIVAREMDISLNAVFIAKSRVLKRLRHEATGLVDSSLDSF